MNPYSHGRGYYGSHYGPNTGPRDIPMYQHHHRPRGGHHEYYRPMRQMILNFQGFREPGTYPLLLNQQLPEYPCLPLSSSLQENNRNLQGIRPSILEKGPSNFRRVENFRNHSLQENQQQNSRPSGTQSTVRPRDTPEGSQNIQPSGTQPAVRPRNSPIKNRNIWGQIRTTVGPNCGVNYTESPSPPQRGNEGNGVKMTDLPFYEVIETPLQSIVDCRPPGWNFNFKLILKETLLSHFRNKSVTAPYHVHLRLCKNDQSNIQKDYFPSDALVLVNNKRCFLPGWNTIPKGTAGPVDITNKCDFIGNINSICVKTRERMVLFVNVTKRLTPDDLLKKLLAKASIDSSATVAKIKEKLQQDSVSGDDITLTSLHFSLLCPVSKTRMRYPCRASTCQHLQCFDAAYYIKMNDKKPKWTCPVCFVVIEYQDLQIDQYFKNVLDKNISTEKILLQADGTYKPFETKKGNQSILTLDDTTETFTANESRACNGNASYSTPAANTTYKFGSSGGGDAATYISSDTEDSVTDNPGRGGGGNAAPAAAAAAAAAYISSDIEDSDSDNPGCSDGFISLDVDYPITDNSGHGVGDSGSGYTTRLTNDSINDSSRNECCFNKSSNQTDASGSSYRGGLDESVPVSYGGNSLHESRHDAGGARQVTIDLLSEDESLMTSAHSASNTASQNHSEPEIVVLSDDEPMASPALRTPGVLGQKFTSTPKIPRLKKRRQKAKAKRTPQTPKMTRIIPNTNIPIDQPGTRMVLRSRVKRNYVE